jgi:UDP-2,3-diacylglucosamine pyrophosphatase LpxH
VPPKTIVISDIHMSNGAGYSWFLPPYPGQLTAMLNRTGNDSSVEELVLLGDVFDLWLYPLDVTPWTVSQILAANHLVTQALRQCVRKIPNVYYMNGNHDMKVVPSDLQPLSSGGKNIQMVTPDWYNAKYQNQRHLEHGHGVDMLNAQDTSGDTLGGYPLGFFIMRLIATAEDQSAVWHALHALMQGFGATHRAMGPAAVDVLSVGSFFVQATITVLEKLARVQDGTPIRFIESELDNKYTVGDIKNHYGSLYSTWFRKYPDPEEFLSAMLAGFLPNGLDWYAKQLISSNASPKVMVMGHTHHAESRSGYDNDGSWCLPRPLGHGDATPNYVVIVGQTATLVPWA